MWQSTYSWRPPRSSASVCRNYRAEEWRYELALSFWWLQIWQILFCPLGCYPTYLLYTDTLYTVAGDEEQKAEWKKRDFFQGGWWNDKRRRIMGEKKTTWKMSFGPVFHSSTARVVSNTSDIESVHGCLSSTSSRIDTASLSLSSSIRLRFSFHFPSFPFQVF